MPQVVVSVPLAQVPRIFRQAVHAVQGATLIEVLEDRAYLDGVLQQGAEKAGVVARKTLADVYERVGFVAPAASLG